MRPRGPGNEDDSKVETLSSHQAWVGGGGVL